MTPSPSRGLRRRRGGGPDGGNLQATSHRMAYSINQAHLIHDHSSGRSSTRLHAPPGGKSSMGTSFGWTDEEPAKPVGRARVGVGIQQTPPVQSMMPPRPPVDRDFQQPPPALPTVPYDPYGPSGPAGGRSGFGDTGNSCVKIHEPAGGKSSMGTSFGWTDESQSTQMPRGGGGQGGGGQYSSGGGGQYSSAQTSSRSNGGPPSTASGKGLGVGAFVLYKGIGGSAEEVAEIVSVEYVDGSRKDNYRIRFADGRERQTTVDKLIPAENTSSQRGPDRGMEYGMQNMRGSNLGWEDAPASSPYSSPQKGIAGSQRHSPADGGDAGFGDTGRSCIRIHNSPGGNNSMGTSFGWEQKPTTMAPRKGDFVESKIGSGVSNSKAAAGELSVGQRVFYKQTPRSEEMEVVVVDLELPSTNGAMRTKTYYTIQFADGSTRQTTIDKISRMR